MKTISSFTSAPVVFMISICAFFIMSCSDDNESNTAPPEVTGMIPKAADSGPIVVKTRGQVASNQRAFTYHWTVVTLAGSDQGYVDGSPAKFNSPSGIAADSLGNTYITDFGNHVIRKTTPAGVVS